MVPPFSCTAVVLSRAACPGVGGGVGLPGRARFTQRSVERTLCTSLKIRRLLAQKSFSSSFGGNKSRVDKWLGEA